VGCCHGIPVPVLRSFHEAWRPALLGAENCGDVMGLSGGYKELVEGRSSLSTSLQLVSEFRAAAVMVFA